MAYVYAKIDSPLLTHDHDITNQQLSSGTNALPVLATRFNDACSMNRHDTVFNADDTLSSSSFSTSFSYGDAGLLSVSSSMTSTASTNSSYDELPTRPSSSQGWTFEGAWSVGVPEPVQARHADADVDLTGDPGEAKLCNSPFLIAQYVALQLRADSTDDFSPLPQTQGTPGFRFTPKIQNRRASGSYTDLIDALGLRTPRMPSRRATFPAYTSPRFTAPVVHPTIMITAPSSETQTSPVVEDDKLLTTYYSPRLPLDEEATPLVPPMHQFQEEYDPEDDICLSQVQRNLKEASRAEQLSKGSKRRYMGLFWI